MWGTVHMASSAIQSSEMRLSPKGSTQPAALVLFVLCVFVHSVLHSHILSVTCLLFAKLFCCKIGQIEKHGRSLCGFHGLYKDAYKLHYEHFVISHHKRLIEILRF